MLLWHLGNKNGQKCAIHFGIQDTSFSSNIESSRIQAKVDSNRKQKFVNCVFMVWIRHAKDFKYAKKAFNLNSKTHNFQYPAIFSILIFNVEGHGHYSFWKSESAGVLTDKYF